MTVKIIPARTGKEVVAVTDRWGEKMFTLFLRYAAHFKNNTNASAASDSADSSIGLLMMCLPIDGVSIDFDIEHKEEINA